MESHTPEEKLPECLDMVGFIIHNHPRVSDDKFFFGKYEDRFGEPYFTSIGEPEWCDRGKDYELKYIKAWVSESELVKALREVTDNGNIPQDTDSI